MLIIKARTAKEYITEARELGKKVTGRFRRVKGQPEVEVECPNPGHPDYFQYIGSIRKGIGCPRCAGKNKPDSEILMEVKQWCSSHVAPTGNIIREGNSAKVEMRCDRGHTYVALPCKIKRYVGCPRCNDTPMLSQHEAISRVDKVHSGNIEVLGKYTGDANRIEVECNICGNIWSPIYDNLIRGSGCPNCASSSGEQTVRAVLEFNNIDYESQHNFKIRGKIHRLDFVLKDKNSHWCVIQPDGEQHFKKNNKFYRGTKLDMDENKHLPALGIRVLRIPYFWFDIDNTFILLEEFLGYNLNKPDKDYIPRYKRIKDIAYEYLKDGDASGLSRKIGVSTNVIFDIFKKYFGSNRTQYVKEHSEYKIVSGVPRAVYSIDKSGKCTEYASAHEASRETGIHPSSICYFAGKGRVDPRGLFWCWVN